MIVSDIILQILQRLDRLEGRYLELEDALKASNGLERCIELRMKLFGFDGKTPAELPPEQISAIDLDRLSESALGELVANTSPVPNASQGLQYHDPLNN